MHSLVKFGALTIALLLGTSACTYAPRHDDPISWSRHNSYYYPHVGVYFHLYSGDYFYRDSNAWVRVKVLPKRYALDHRVRRTLVIKDELPYRYHARHREHHRLPADFRYDWQHDKAEREHNHRRHMEYRQRRHHPPMNLR